MLNLGPQLGALAVLGVLRVAPLAGRASRALFGFLGSRPPTVAARIWRSRSGVPVSILSSSAARFVGEFVGDCQLGNPAAFLRLAFAKLAQFRLGGGHT